MLIRPILEGYKLNDKVLERCLEKYGKEKVEILGNSSTDHPYPVAQLKLRRYKVILTVPNQTLDDGSQLRKFIEYQK